MTATDPPALRDLLAEIVASGLFGSADGLGVADVRVLAVSNHDLRAIVDALLADPRIAVVALPEYVDPELSSGSLGFFWTNPQAATELAAALLAAVTHNNRTTTEGNPS